MFDYLHGTLASKKPTHVVVDVGGAGYRVEISLTTHDRLPAEGQRVRLLTFLRPAEDAWTLYGFATEEERTIFKELVEHVSQLGPRKAMTILSHATVAELRGAIESGDAGRLRRIKGVGEKLANRVITELRGKIPEAAATAPAGPQADAVQALVSLGYDRRAAEDAVRGAGDGSAEVIVRKALQRL